MNKQEKQVIKTSTRPKRKTRIMEEINSLEKKDIYSLLLFVLYKLHDDPNYVTLTELSYLLDKQSLSKFLNYYEGMTITIPSMRDMRLVIDALTLYEYVELEKGTFEEGIKGICTNEFSEEEISKVYKTIIDVLSNYNFKK